MKKTQGREKRLGFDTYLFLLFVEIVDDHTNEQVEGEKGSKDDEKDKVKVHVNVDLTDRLLAQLQEKYILKIGKKK